MLTGNPSGLRPSTSPLGCASLTAHGLKFTGSSPDGTYVEICELEDHPWYLGCQFHPEFKSKPFEPHPLFAAFVGAAYKNKAVDAVAARKEPAATTNQA